MKGTRAFKLDKPGFKCKLCRRPGYMTLGQLPKLFESGITLLPTTQGHYMD